MDKYSKVILTIIAVAVSLIAIKMYFPYVLDRDFAHHNLPDYGDFLRLREIHDSTIRNESRSKLIRRLPLVRIQGGQVDADVTGSVEIDR